MKLPIGHRIKLVLGIYVKQSFKFVIPLQHAIQLIDNIVKLLDVPLCLGIKDLTVGLDFEYLLGLCQILDKELIGLVQGYQRIQNQQYEYLLLSIGL